MKTLLVSIEDRWKILMMIVKIETSNLLEANIIHNLKTKLYFSTEEIDCYKITLDPEQKQIKWKEEGHIEITFGKAEEVFLYSLLNQQENLNIDSIPDCYVELFS